MAIVQKMRISDTINHLYSQVLEYAQRNGLTNNVEIHISQYAANQLMEMGELKNIDGTIVIDSKIKDRKQDDGTYLSDMYLFDPEWMEEE